ncbi:MAG: response regulator transcription factor [Anaerolineales bacterium]|jgi:DNA-binding NarL/FixJ family response regulator|nr:response regulator transcription factor [Anaerolineales bacterium]
MTVRVMVADDHSLFRDGLVSLLEAAGYEIAAQVADGQEALIQAKRTRPDLILLDLSMPRMNGHEALPLLLEIVPDAKVVILTVSEEDDDLLKVILAGAHGYLVKSLNADDFLELLGGLERGEAAVTGRTAARLMAKLAENRLPMKSLTEALTARELELLELVGEGFSNRALSDKLSISTNTVKYHLKNIFQKLGAQNRAEAVAHAIRTGILSSSQKEDLAP